MNKENNNKNELIVCIINDGFSDLVMYAAKNAGARGGTIFHAKGTGNSDIEKFFGITITPEKEIVFIIVEKDQKDEIVSAIYKEAGLDTKGQGIVFTLPVDDFVGPSLVEEESPEKL